MAEPPVNTAAFWIAFVLLEAAIPMIVPNKFWAGIAMAALALPFLASAFGWLPSLNRALRWKYSLPAFVLIGASLGACAWGLTRRFASPRPTVERTGARPSTNPLLVGTMATSFRPAKDPEDTRIQLKVTVVNRGGMPSVVKQWTFGWVCGDRKGIILVAPLYAINEKDESGGGLIDEQPSKKIVIQPGDEADYTLRYTIPVSVDDIRQKGLDLHVTLFDVMGNPSEIEDHTNPGSF